MYLANIYAMRFGPQTSSSAAYSLTKLKLVSNRHASAILLAKQTKERVASPSIAYIIYRNPKIPNACCAGCALEASAIHSLHVNTCESDSLKSSSGLCHYEYLTQSKETSAHLNEC